MAEVVFDRATRMFPGADRAAVDALNLHIDEGEFMVLVGPSGCGKSTSLRMLAGLEDVNGGSIRIGERDVSQLAPRDRDIAMVFQSYALYPHMTVRENMAFSLKVAGVSKNDRTRRVADAARILDLQDYLDRKPRELSGGQRQRVAMGRAIVREPQVFLMDEPLSNLDAKLRVSTRTQVAELQRRLGVTTVYVTHDQVEAMTMGDRVAVLNAGVLQQVDTPLKLYEKPANVFVAGFIGSPAMNIDTHRVADGHARVGQLDVPLSRDALSVLGRQKLDSVILGVRPESLDVVAAEDGFSVLVTVVEELGSEAFAYCVIEGDEGGSPSTDVVSGRRIVALVDSRNPPRKGDRLHLRARAGEEHLFSPTTGERLLP